MTSKKELQESNYRLRAWLEAEVNKVGGLRKEVERLEKSLARAEEDCTTAYHRQQAVEQENAELREGVERLRKEVEYLREEAADMRARLYNAEKALEVLAPMLYRRYAPKGVLRWDDLIADAKRVEEYNATTEVLHFIEASQEGEPF